MSISLEYLDNLGKKLYEKYKNTNPNVGGSVMTLAQALEKKGREEERITIARNLKSDGMDVKSIAMYTGISEDEIEAIKI